MSRVLGLAIVLAAGMAPAAQPLTVCAAISLSDALQEAARAYTAAGGGPVRFNFAGSNVLARQLASGAPADLFVSADEAQMDVAERAGAIDKSSRVELLANRLAIVVRRDAAPVADARGLATPSIRRIAIGDPAAVPAGVYARRYLEAVGVWGAISSKVVPVGNVRAALAVVLNGSADAGIVYESDTINAGSLNVTVVADGRAPPVVYPAAIVARSSDRAGAERLLAFLRGTQAASIFRRYKFVPVAAGH